MCISDSLPKKGTEILHIQNISSYWSYVTSFCSQKKDKSDVERELYETAIELPNQTHPAVVSDHKLNLCLLPNIQ